MRANKSDGEGLRHMEKLFFSEALTGKLEKVKTCALSALEAPAGYGKTTAVRWLFAEGDATVRWYTSVEGMADNSFRWFIRQLGAVDETAARALEDLGYLNRSNAEQAAQILSELHPSEPLTLIFDNFQFALQSWQPQVLDALAKCGADGVRTVFISQNFGRLRDVLSILGDSVCYIRSRDLLLSERDIDTFARRLGIPATAEEIHAIHQKTDGWTAAVALYLENLRDALLESGSEGLDDLLSATFWQRLTEEQRRAMLRLCLFDQITPETLHALAPADLLPPEELTQLLRRAPLILYRETRKSYYPHELLSAFLRRRLAETDADFQSEVLRASAEVYRASGRTREAVSCYFRARHYASILACRLVCLITEQFDGATYTELARTVLRECPEDIQIQYPLSLLRLCYALYAGCASMWYLFYAEPGTMLQTADKLAETMKLYNRLTNGHGAGAARCGRRARRTRWPTSPSPTS